MSDDQEIENFWEVVGSDRFDTDKEEFLARIAQCEQNDFVYDQESGKITFNSACSGLVVHSPELYTEIFCRDCGVCIEIKSISTLEDKIAEDADDMDEFLSIAGTEQNFQSYMGYEDDAEECVADDYCEEIPSETKW